MTSSSTIEQSSAAPGSLAADGTAGAASARNPDATGTDAAGSCAGAASASKPSGDFAPPWLLAIIAMLAVQLANALSVPLSEQVGAGGTAWLRMLCGGVFLLLFSRRIFKILRKKDLPILLDLGATTGCMTMCFLEAASRIPLGTAVAIEFLGPLTVAAVFSGKLNRLVWPALALAGVVLLTEPWTGEINPTGVVFALLSGVCWGTYNLLTQKVGDRYSGISGLTITIPIGALAITPVGLPQALHGTPSWWVLLGAAGVALLTPVLAFGLEMLALRRLTHTAFGTLLSVEPAIGALIGFIVLAQAPHALQLLGILVVVGAGAAAVRSGDRAAQDS